jgi:hypothetical protein
MPRRFTKSVKFIRLSEKRIREIEELVSLWPYETKAFMRARFLQYKPRSDIINALLESFLSFF